MDKKLIEAVKGQLGEGWRDDLNDVARHGASGGFCGFIYNSETDKFFRDNRGMIVNLVKDMADEFDQTPIDFVNGFRCLDGQGDEAEIARALYGRIKSDECQVTVALAWFALEEVALYLQETGALREDESDGEGE